VINITVEEYLEQVKLLCEQWGIGKITSKELQHNLLLALAALNPNK
jgi:hypothetical protein